eukprot:1050249_1
MPKYVVVSGGVVSGLGKGITASSIGLLLRESGLKVTSIKIDPYLNIDAGTMSPYEHGEVYVLDDGGEVDLDLGNYERFMDVTLTRDHNITTGKVYESVIKREREGCYLGKTVQVVPHITDAIQDWISRVSIIPVDGSGQTPDVCIIELGGTVGDIESMVFLEALRQFEFRVGRDNFCHLHVSLIPVVGAVGEQKSKPAQHSVKELRAAGLLPQMIVCRSKEPITRSILEKISLFGMVPPNRVISVHDVQNIYQVPSMLLEQNLPALILSSLRLHKMVPAELPLWDSIACKSLKSLPTVTIGIVGKYTGLADSYLSVTKALRSAAMHADRHCKLVWVEATRLEREHKRSDPDQYTEAWKLLSEVDGILCPGGFGDRGTEGKILAAQFARENNVPYLGICLGMQVRSLCNPAWVQHKRAGDAMDNYEPKWALCDIGREEGGACILNFNMREHWRSVATQKPVWCGPEIPELTCRSVASPRIWVRSRQPVSTTGCLVSVSTGKVRSQGD